MLSSASGEARSSDTAKQTGYKSEKIGWLCCTQNRTDVRWSQSILEKLNLCVSLSAIRPDDYSWLAARFAQPNKTWQRCSRPGSNMNPQRQKRKAPSSHFSVHSLWWQPTLGREQGQSNVEWKPDPSQGQSCSIHHTTSPCGLRKPTHHGHIHTSKKRFLPKQITQRAPPTRSFLSAQGLCVIFFLLCK